MLFPKIVYSAPNGETFAVKQNVSEKIAIVILTHVTLHALTTLIHDFALVNQKNDLFQTANRVKVT